jgi:hypothetical protein
MSRPRLLPTFAADLFDDIVDGEKMDIDPTHWSTTSLTGRKALFSPPSHLLDRSESRNSFSSMIVETGRDPAGKLADPYEIFDLDNRRKEKVKGLGFGVASSVLDEGLEKERSAVPESKARLGESKARQDRTAGTGRFELKPRAGRIKATLEGKVEKKSAPSSSKPQRATGGSKAAAKQGGEKSRQRRGSTEEQRWGGRSSAPKRATRGKSGKKGVLRNFRRAAK